MYHFNMATKNINIALILSDNDGKFMMRLTYGSHGRSGKSEELSPLHMPAEITNADEVVEKFLGHGEVQPFALYLLYRYNFFWSQLLVID